MSTKQYLIVVAVLVIGILSGWFAHTNHPLPKFGDSSTSLPGGLIVGGSLYAVTPALTIVGTTTQLSFATTTNGGNGLSGVVSGGPSLTFIRNPLNQATTTVCSIQTPSATSSLIGGSVAFTTASTTASVITVASALTPFATTTVLATSSIAANAMGTLSFTASSTENTLYENNLVFSPLTYINVSMSGGIGTFSPIGGCTASFMSAI